MWYIFNREADTEAVFRQVAWLSVGQESILALDGHVITKNHRISVSHSDQHTWNLHLHDVRLADAGWYMCQVNTDPMKVQTSYLDVVGKFERPEY